MKQVESKVLLLLHTWTKYSAVAWVHIEKVVADCRLIHLQFLMESNTEKKNTALQNTIWELYNNNDINYTIWLDVINVRYVFYAVNLQISFDALRCCIMSCQKNEHQHSLYCCFENASLQTINTISIEHQQWQNPGCVIDDRRWCHFHHLLQH